MGLTTDLVMPKLGLTMTEGRLAEWRVNAGDKVAQGDILFVVETDKIANEVDAPASGQIVDVLVGAGETVPVGTVLARWTGPGVASGDEATAATAAPPRAPLNKPTDPGPPADTRPSALSRFVSTPLARRLARQHGLDLSLVPGTGPKGRIKAGDISRALNGIAVSAPNDPTKVSAGPPPAAPGPTPVAQRRKPTHLEALAARRLVQTMNQVPHFYLSAAADVTRLDMLREDIRHVSPSPPTVTHFMILAIARALNDLPWANSIWFADEIVTFGRVDIAVATDTPHGLLAPVLRNVGQMALDDIVPATRTLVERARMNKLTTDDFEGGAVAVSNLGMHGVDMVIPIINAPQAVIMGIGRLRTTLQPDDKSTPIARREVSLVLSCDHRVLDGLKGAKLLRQIVSYLEHPGRLMSVAASTGT